MMRMMNNKWICILVICLFFVLNCNVVYGHIYEDKYPYKTTVTVKTGEGTVYASYNSIDNYAATPTTQSASYLATITSSSNTTSVTLNAAAAEGFTFDRWEYSDGTLLTKDTHSPTVQLTYDTNNARRNQVSDGTIFLFISLYHYEYTTEREFSFNAYFKEEGAVSARVENGQEAIGSAVVAEETDEMATLVARTINGSEISGWTFDYWSVGDNTEVYSEESTIQVPIPEEGKVVYVAHFVRVDSESYCFIRNKTTKRYLKLSDTKNYTVPSSENQPATFNGSFTLVEESEAISDPGCVFIVIGTSNNGGLRKAKLISQSKAVGSEATSVIIQSDISIIPVFTDVYTISTQYKYNNKPLTLYFRDNNGTPDMYNVASANSEWELLVLNRENLQKTYFGVKPNALLKRGGKYYTTLCTTFPYEVTNGTAYYIDDSSIVPYGDDSGKYRVVCHEFRDKKVPDNVPVIIECDGTDAASNKLLPLPMGSVPQLESTSLLKGQIKVVNGTKSGDGNIYVLSVSPETMTNVGFYKLKSGVAIPDNKAYADLPEEAQNAAKSITYVFGDDIDTPTTIEEVALPEDIAGQPIYDLQGRKVVNPSNGIYIVNGKKLIIK